MKNIDTYNNENINLLKLWLRNMAAQGHAKYYEILSDGMRVVHRTNDPEQFDNYLQWFNETNKSMRVLVYNTAKSHRSQVFEYRTANYVEGVSHQLYATRKPKLTADEVERRVQQAIEEKQKHLIEKDREEKTKELNQRLLEAERYIQDLEAQAKKNKEQKNSFDVNSLLSLLSGFAASNLQAGEKLGEINTLLGTSNISQVQAEAKPTGEFIQVPRAGLDDKQCAKVMELAVFLSANPQYIDIVYDLFKGEALKMAG
ncbi:MAG: hypothetical protein ACXVAU_07730 [Mucilaginibacter sp.]